MFDKGKRFHPIRGPLLIAAAFVLIAGTAPASWAQKSQSKSSGSQKMQSSRPSSPSSTVRSSPSRSSTVRSSPSRSSTVRSSPSPSSRSSVGSSSRSSKGSGLPRSGYSSGPTVYRKGPMPSNPAVRGGPTPGRPYTPRDSGGGHDSGGSHHGSGHGYYGGGHGYYGGGHGYYGGGHGYYGGGYSYYLGAYYPHYRPYYYRPYYYFGLGYGYYPHFYPYYYPYSSRYRVVNVEAQGALDLNVKPKDTQVYLNGYYIGTTGDFDGWPRYLWLDEDVHELIFYKEGYETVVREVSVRPDAVINLKFRMQPGPSTSPDELTEYKDREEREPRYSTGRSGDRDDDRRYGDLPRRESQYRERDGEAGRDLPPVEDIDLRSESGRLVLKVSPPEASVYIDGRFVGIGGELAEIEVGLLMDSGEHRIQVFHPGHETEERTFEIVAGKDTKLGISLK